MNKLKISTEELVSMLKNRDEDGFNYLYDNYSGALYGIIIKVLTYKEETNEVLQDVFVKIWNSIQSFDENKGSLYTWMLNVARNAAIDKVKSKSFRNDLKNQSIPDFVNDSKSLSTEQKHEFNEVQNIVNTLRDDYKVIINKSYFGGYTQEEISEDLGIPLGTVKTRSRAAIKELREMLKGFKNSL